MGMHPEDIKTMLLEAVACRWRKPAKGVVLVAPASATFLDRFATGNLTEELILGERWRYPQHINLDDLDIGNDGVWSTLRRVIGRRGLVLWDVQRKC